MRVKNIFLLCFLIVGIWAQTQSLTDFINQKKVLLAPNCVRNNPKNVCIQCAEGYNLKIDKC